MDLISNNSTCDVNTSTFRVPELKKKSFWWARNWDFVVQFNQFAKIICRGCDPWKQSQIHLQLWYRFRNTNKNMHMICFNVWNVFLDIFRDHKLFTTPTYQQWLNWTKQLISKSSMSRDMWSLLKSVWPFLSLIQTWQILTLASFCMTVVVMTLESQYHVMFEIKFSET